MKSLHAEIHAGRSCLGDGVICTADPGQSCLSCAIGFRLALVPECAGSALQPRCPVLITCHHHHHLGFGSHALCLPILSPATLLGVVTVMPVFPARVVIVTLGEVARLEAGMRGLAGLSERWLFLYFLFCMFYLSGCFSGVLLFLLLYRHWHYPSRKAFKALPEGQCLKACLAVKSLYSTRELAVLAGNRANWLRDLKGLSKKVLLKILSRFICFCHLGQTEAEQKFLPIPQRLDWG